MDALVGGSKDVTRVRQALVTTAAPRTVITPALAAKVARRVSGPEACTMSPSIGEVCGPTARLNVAVDGCRAARVGAVVARLPGGLKMALGRDVIEKSVKAIDFSTAPATFRCQRSR